jgi:hypothetical protein
VSVMIGCNFSRWLGSNRQLGRPAPPDLYLPAGKESLIRDRQCLITGFRMVAPFTTSGFAFCSQREIAKQLATSDGWRQKYRSSVSSRDPHDRTAELLRLWLNWTFCLRKSTQKRIVL